VQVKKILIVKTALRNIFPYIHTLAHGLSINLEFGTCNNLYYMSKTYANNPLKILLVEDQQITAEDLEALLIDWGYHVVGCAVSGDEAFDLFNQFQPDLALVDVNIEGDIDGIETVKQFNKIKPIPIVYLTAQADTETIERAKSSNPFAYLIKPFDEQNLQISLDIAFNMFARHKTSFSRMEDTPLAPANDVKLNAEMILQIEDSIFIKQNYRFVKISKDDIVFIEADRNHSYIQTKQHRYIVRMPLVAVVERLQNDKLIRVHRSFAVNLKHVQEFNESEIIIHGKDIPFSNNYRTDFLKNFNII
jgi:two-component system, response regulator PdtaR